MARLRSLLLLCLLLLAPASASAATLGEVPPVDLPGDEYCMRATGMPGEIAVPTEQGVRFVRATSDGLTLGEEVRLGADFRCGTLVARPNGAAVIAGEIPGKGVVAVVREPGGGWGAPQIMAVDNFAVQVVASVSERGDAIVAVKENLEDGKHRFRVARRLPSGRFGPLERLGREGWNTGQISVAIAATGEAFALWTTIEGAKPDYHEPVNLAIAPAGRPFGAAAQVAEMPWLASPGLTAAADGRALVALSDGKSLLVAERAPGAAAFGPATAIGQAGDASGVVASARLGTDGAAAIGWARGFAGDVQIAMRPAGATSFSAPVTAVHSATSDFDPFYSSTSFLATIFDSVGSVYTRGEPSSFLSLTADGRAFAATAPGIAGADTGAVLATLAGGVPLIDTAGAGPARPNRAVALTLADGTAAIAWTTSLDDEHFRLHLAYAATTEQPDPAAPTVRVGRPDRTRVSEEQSLKLPITCSGPCEVTVYVSVGGFSIPYRARINHAGTRKLDIDSLHFIARGKPGPVRLRMSYGALGALHPSTRTISVRVARADGPEPRATQVKAVRRGDRVVVTFHVTGDPRRWGAFVTGDDTREWSGGPAVLRTIAGKRGKRNYRLTLPAQGVKYVTLRTPVLGALPGAKVTVEVR
jgi:hypothetical protein